MNRRLALLSKKLSSSLSFFLGRRKGVTFVPLAGDFFGDWPNKTYALRTDGEWEAAWMEHTPSAIPAPARPKVDFQKSAILGVSLGWGTSCERVTITKVTREGNTHAVEYRRVNLFPDALCAAHQWPLVAFVLVSAPVGEVIFNKME
jgi:hypothetical protein